jgi:hypothetical protein
MEEDLKLLLDEAYGNVENALRILRELNEVARHRYFSLAVTHSEEAQNWLLRYTKEHRL